MGMYLELLDPRRLILPTVEYTKQILKDFEKHLGRILAMAAADHIFQVMVEMERSLMTEEQAHMFHRGAVQLFFLMFMCEAGTTYHCGVSQ